MVRLKVGNKVYIKRMPKGTLSSFYQDNVV